MAKLNELTLQQKRAKQARIDRATQLLSYYIETAWRKVGLGWSSDNQAEVRDLVEVLLEDR